MEAKSKKYQIILCDPPWHYENYSNQWHKDNPESRWVGNQYDTLSVTDICALPIQRIADDNCVLFLWTTPPCLQEAMQVLNAWGFKYKTKAFCWVKTNANTMGLFTGMGYWTRANTEDCWLATKGHPKRLDASVHQVVMSDVMNHSHKPAIIREKIVQLMGDLPRIELFARRKVEGWDSIGFDIDGHDIKDSLNALGGLPE